VIFRKVLTSQLTKFLGDESAQFTSSLTPNHINFGFPAKNVNVSLNKTFNTLIIKMDFSIKREIHKKKDLLETLTKAKNFVKFQQNLNNIQNDDIQ
jgi:hypothetical protein